MKYLFCLLASLLILSCAPQKESSLKAAQYLETEEFAKNNYPFSEAVIYGDIIYASGQIGETGTEPKLVEGGIVPETHQALLNIKDVLERNGSSMDNIIKCTCMLADISDWAAMSKEYVTFFPNHKPARSAFATTGLAMNARVEIECMAYISNESN
jgi:2-iminobutanoate/2-iminopropanoate deaminase